MPRAKDGRRVNKFRASADASPSRPGSPGEPGQRSHGGGGRKPLPPGHGPGLYVVSTPIGNARDVTLRALDILAAADVIACEDTRVTSRLLAVHAISAPLVAYHEHNAEKARPALIKRLKNGETVALASDAGTPLVSDPGYKLVRACVAEGIPVTALPGASAILPAVVLSGLPAGRFLFAGFLPPKAAARNRALVELARVPAALVFMESPRRLAAALQDMAGVLGPRQASVARELTKKFEEVRRGMLVDLAAYYQDAGPPKGEVTIVVAPPAAVRDWDAAEVDQMLRDALGRQSVRDAAAGVAAETGLSRRGLYARALELRRGAP